jgi:hypothetical protein
MDRIELISYFDRIPSTFPTDSWMNTPLSRLSIVTAVTSCRIEARKAARRMYPVIAAAVLFARLSVETPHAIACRRFSNLKHR